MTRLCRRTQLLVAILYPLLSWATSLHKLHAEHEALLSMYWSLIWRALLFSDGQDTPSSNRRFSRHHVILEKYSGVNGQNWALILASVSTHVGFKDQQGNVRDKVANQPIISPLKSHGHRFFTGTTLAPCCIAFTACMTRMALPLSAALSRSSEWCAASTLVVTFRLAHEHTGMKT